MLAAALFSCRSILWSFQTKIFVKLWTSFVCQSKIEIYVQLQNFSSSCSTAIQQHKFVKPQQNCELWTSFEFTNNAVFVKPQQLSKN